MTASQAFLGIFGVAGVGVVLALVLEVAGHSRAASYVSGWALLLGGGVGVSAGWLCETDYALAGFVAGEGFSAIPGVALALAGSVILVAGPERRGSSSFTHLVGLGALGAGLAVAASDIVSLLLAIETAALCGYALVAIARTARASEASIKYFVQGAVASAILVTGIAGLVAFVSPDGTYRGMSTVLTGLQIGGPAVAASLLVIAALAFKSGAAPFHFWAPDAYETAGPAAAAFMSGAYKLAAITAIVVVTTTVSAPGMSAESPLGTVGARVMPLVALMAGASVLIGSFAALRQTSYARMLAYAGIAQVGYALIALSAFNATAAVIQAVTYSIGTTGAYLAMVAFRRARPSWDGTIAGLAGLGRSNALLGVSMVAIVASLAGIPPLAGFWGKFQSLASVIYAATAFSDAEKGIGVMYFALAVTGIVGAVVALGYYGAVLRALFIDTAPEADESEPGGSLGTTVYAIVVFAVGMAPLVFGIAQVLNGVALR